MGRWYPWLVTAVATAVFIAMGWIEVPGLVDPYRHDAYFVADISLNSVGLLPILLAWGAVEVVAMVVPSLAARRIAGPEARAPLRRVSVALAAVFAAIEAVAIMRFVPVELMNPLVVGASLVGATMLTVALMQWIDRAGVGGGMVVLLAVVTLGDWAWLINLQTLHEPWVAVGGWGLAMAGLAAYGWLRGATTTTGQARTWNLMVPLSGVFPLLLLQEWWWRFPTVRSRLDPFTYDVLELALLIGLTVGLGWLFHPPRKVAGTWFARSSPVPRGLVQSAIVMVLFYLVLLHSGAVAAWLNPVFTMAAVMVGLDWADEARFRSAQGRLVVAHELHRTHAVAPALTVLQQAEIDAHVRNVRARSLLQSLGPCIPMAVLVPEESAEAAREALRTGGLLIVDQSAERADPPLARG